MTFIPLDTIEVKPINEALRSAHSWLYMYMHVVWASAVQMSMLSVCADNWVEVLSW